MIVISVRSKYGLCVLLHMAKYPDQKPWRIQALADACEVPKKYLELILGSLRQAGFVESTRGAHGGYALAKPAAEITAYQIACVLEQDLRFASGYNGKYGLERFWQSVDLSLEKGLNVTLETLVLESGVSITYSI